MAIFNIANENEFQARMKMFMCDDLYQKNYETGQYERVVSGGGGPEPIVLPYYLRSNSVKVDNVGNTTYSQLDENSVDVVDVGGNKSSSLLSDRLVIGDIDGNSELDREGIDVLNNLKSITSIAEPAASTNKLVLHDPATGSFGYSNSFTVEGGGYKMTALPASTTRYVPSFNRFSKLSWAELVLAHTNDGISVDSTKDHVILTPSRLMIREAGGTTKTLTSADIEVCNKLKAPTNLTVTHDHKAVVFNTVTGAYNTIDVAPQWMAANDLRTASYLTTPTSNTKLLTKHSGTGEYNYIDIPTGVVVPSYLKTSSIEMHAPDGASEAYITAANGNQTQITVRNKTAAANYTSLNELGIHIKPVIGATASLNWDGVTYLNKHRGNYHQKKLTGIYYFPMINDALDGVITGNGASAVPAFNMANHDEIYIYTNGGDRIRYKRWYAIRIGDSTPLPNSLVELSIVEHYDGNYDSNNIASIHMTRLPTAITTPFTVQAGCIPFKIGNPNGSITTNDNFNGVIKIKMLNRDTTTMNNV